MTSRRSAESPPSPRRYFLPAVEEAPGSEEEWSGSGAHQDMAHLFQLALFHLACDFMRSYLSPRKPQDLLYPFQSVDGKFISNVPYCVSLSATSDREGSA